MICRVAQVIRQEAMLYSERSSNLEVRRMGLLLRLAMKLF